MWSALPLRRQQGFRKNAGIAFPQRMSDSAAKTRRTSDMANKQQAPGKVPPDLLASLDALAVPELDALIAAARERREAKRETGRRELLEEVKAKAEALGLPLSALFEGAVPSRRPAGRERPSRKGTRPPVRPKYRNPETGETWSGRGSAPKWLRQLEEQGRGREEFAAEE
jgi:DNA-binding protein H-NS